MRSGRAWSRCSHHPAGTVDPIRITAGSSTASCSSATPACPTGVPWRDLPERYGPWQTVYSRLRRWTTRGLWERLLGQLQARLAEEDRIAWTLWCIEGSVVRAHKAAAGARHCGGGKSARRAG
ncbi:MAG TPA: transposase [Gemmatimonadales bacterium]|nr:transposase [Gemmatimonadales bacterium]